MHLELNLKSVLKVANPIMLGSFVQFILTFVDTAFLGHIGELELNAAGNAGLIYVTLFLVAQGLSEGLQILTTRRLSEKQPEAVRNLFWNASFSLLILAGLSFLLVGYGSNLFLPWITKDLVLVEAMGSFLDIRAWGYFFSIIQLGLIGFYSGAAQTKILAYSTTVLALVNLVFDYLLIYGVWIFPEMGLQGAAAASVLAEACALLFCIVYVRRDTEIFKLIRFTGFTWVPKQLKALLKLSYPIMGQRFLAMSSWTVFFFFIEKLGSHNLAISQLIRSLYFLAFIPIMGFGTTTKTFISYYMARRDFDMVKKATKFLCYVSLGILILLIHGYLLYPQLIITLLTDDAQLIADTAPVLQLVFFEAIVFILAIVLSNAVAGVGDTKASFLIENICITIYIAAAYVVTVLYPQPIIIVWCMEFVYFSLLLLFSFLYFKLRPWRQIKI